MNAFEILDIIRRRPAYVDKSLTLLRSFLMGFEMGIQSCGVQESTLGEMRPFSIWVAKELGFRGYSKGWCKMIRESTDSEERAFEYFFELLDKYKKETGNILRSA